MVFEAKAKFSILIEAVWVVRYLFMFNSPNYIFDSADVPLCIPNCANLSHSR